MRIFVILVKNDTEFQINSMIIKKILILVIYLENDHIQMYRTLLREIRTMNFPKKH